jgi:hypothetical protein
LLLSPLFFLSFDNLPWQLASVRVLRCTVVRLAAAFRPRTAGRREVCGRLSEFAECVLNGGTCSLLPQVVDFSAYNVFTICTRKRLG